jgi:hypothetical protein
LLDRTHEEAGYRLDRITGEVVFAFARIRFQTWFGHWPNNGRELRTSSYTLIFQSPSCAEARDLQSHLGRLLLMAGLLAEVVSKQSHSCSMSVFNSDRMENNRWLSIQRTI